MRMMRKQGGSENHQRVALDGDQHQLALPTTGEQLGDACVRAASETLPGRGSGPLQSAMRTTVGLLGAGLIACSVNTDPVKSNDAAAATSAESSSESSAETTGKSKTSDKSRSKTSTSTESSQSSSTDDGSSAAVETSQESSTTEPTATASSETTTTLTYADSGAVPDCDFTVEELGSLWASNIIEEPPDASASAAPDAGPHADAGAAALPDADAPDADALDADAPHADLLDGASTDGAAAFTPRELRGWASVAGYGQPATFGGATGALVVAKTAKELQQYASASEPLVIAVCGRIRAPSVRVSSNKTLVGVGRDARIEGGIHLEGSPDDYVRNVIISNLELDAADSNVYGFGVRLEYAHHVWLDHLEIFDSREGAIDVVYGSDLVTISWTRMFHTPSTAAQEKRFGVRVGDVDNDSVYARDGERLRVTLHHNLWGERLRQRMPRVAYGQVHVANNYYAPTTEDYAIWGTWRDAQIRVEKNLFQATHNPHMLHNEGLNQFPDEDERADMLAVGNVYFDSSGVQESNNVGFTPPYDFEFDDPSELATLVTEGAGPRWPL